MSRILLVEDDQSLGLTLKERLEKEKYQVDWVCTKAEVVQRCLSSAVSPPYEIIILDVGLPDGSGLDLGRDLRLAHEIPIIFLSAMNSAEFRLEGFELGAEDYIPKPFHLKELLLRIRRVLDRQGHARLISCEKFNLEVDAMALLFADGTRVNLGARDFQLLKHLIEATPRVVSREEILAQVWGGDASQTGRSVDNSVLRLRQILRKVEGDPIRSVRGVGYQWLP